MHQIFIFFLVYYYTVLCQITSTQPQIEPEILSVAELYRRELARQLKDVPISPIAKCLANINHLAIRNLSTTPKKALSDFLGNGYDKLTDEAKWPIFKETFDNCNTTADFRYFVPDFYRAEKIYKGNVDKTSKIFSSMKEYKKESSVGVGAGGSTGSVGASFSASSSSTKSNMESLNKSLIFVKASMLLYRFEGYPGAHFSDDFRERVLAVVHAMRKNLIRTSRWLVEEIYRDFGMEVIMGADLGVKIERRSFVSSLLTKASSEMSNALKAGVEGNSGGGAGASAQFKMNTFQKSTSMLKKVERTDVISVWGGPDFDKMASNDLNDFMKLDNLAAISYKTLEIHKLMHVGALGRLDLTGDEILNLRMLFENVYDEVILRNTYRGCTNNEYYNFDFQANVDDNTCETKRCQLFDIDFKCSITTTTCPHKVAENKKKLDEVELELNERAFRKFKIDEKLEKLEKKSFDETVIEFQYKSKIFTDILNATECETTTIYEIPSASFFGKCDIEAYKSCAQKGKIVEKQGMYYNDVCNNSIPVKWNKPPIFGGFFQLCTASETTLSYDKQLEELQQGRVSRCKGLNVVNIVTNDSSCPSGMTKKLIKSYIHTLPDYFVTHKHFEGNKFFEFNIILKEQVNISTYWCTYESNENPAALYYGGTFETGQRNSYIGANGCGFTKLIESPIFHDTKICIGVNFEKSLNTVPELRSMFTGMSDRPYCNPKESKHLMTIINNDPVYACIYKKKGFYFAPPAVLAKLPFKEQQTMFEYYGESTLEMKVNGKLKVYTLKSLADQFLFFIKTEIRAARIIETTPVAILEQKESMLFATNYTIIIIIGVVLLIIGITVAVLFL